MGVGLCQGCPLSQILFVIFIEKISRCSQGGLGVGFRDLRITSLLFADDVILLTSTDRDLQHTPGSCVAECEAVESQHV